MLLGHYGVAFALKRAEPKLSLGTLFLAVQLADLLLGIFLLLGWQHYSISHSLVAAVAWGAAGAALYYSWPSRDTARHWQTSAMVGLAIFSHYPLDVLVHLPDLPLAGSDSPKLGLGLWNHPGATMVAELGVLSIGVAIYVVFRSQRYPVRLTRLAVLLLVLFGTYLRIQLGPLSQNITATTVNTDVPPAPPSPAAEIQARSPSEWPGPRAILFMLTVAGLAAWADRRARAE